MLHPDATFFFEDPGNDPNRPGRYGRYSILYLLRRDIWFCFGLDPTTKCKTTKAVWPGGMAILAGVDLLAKFYKGDDEPGKGKVGQRFREFVRKYFQPILSGDEKTIYQLRNSLLHSFGLYSQGKDQKIYRFVLTQGGDTLVTNDPPDYYWVDLTVLHRRFEKAVDRYKDDLSGNQSLQEKFLKMFENYGSTKIRIVRS